MFEHVPEGLGRPIKIELFTFSDASGRVIGTCVYMKLTFQQEGGVKRYAALGIARSRTKRSTASIPTAEALSILDATTLAEMVRRVFNVERKDCYFYNDSKAAIGKIRKAKRGGILSVKAHLAPCISKILSKIEDVVHNLRYIPTELNGCADVITRGCTVPVSYTHLTLPTILLV